MPKPRSQQISLLETPFISFVAARCERLFVW